MESLNESLHSRRKANVPFSSNYHYILTYSNYEIKFTNKYSYNEISPNFGKELLKQWNQIGFQYMHKEIADTKYLEILNADLKIKSSLRMNYYECKISI
ncbi:MAG: hypothetical protein WC139_12805 [Candidatus Kapaibacterium sp.]